MMSLKKFMICSIIIGGSCNAQNNYWNVYVPLHTTHFNPTHEFGTPIGYHEGFLGSEGGQGGAIVSYNEVKSKKYTSSYTVGAAQNSYGDLIGMITKGYIFNNNLIDVGIEMGFVTGYAKSFKREKERVGLEDELLFELAEKIKVLPFVTMTLNKQITKQIGIKALLNPIYVNFGINIRIL